MFCAIRKRVNSVIPMMLFFMLTFPLLINFASAQEKNKTDNFLDVEFLSSRDLNVLRFNNPLWSPDGQFIALSDENYNGVYLYNTVEKTYLKLTDAPSSGYAYNWSYDSKKLGFKLLIPVSDNFPLQMPVIFDIEKDELIPLYSAVQRSGVPPFSKNGLIAFTVDQNLKIADDSGNILDIPLGNYANLTPISPDGKKVVYNTADFQIWIIDVKTGRRNQLTSDTQSYFNPVWSPDSLKLIVSTVSSELKTIDISTGNIYKLDRGWMPSWSSDSTTIFYSKIDAIEGFGVTDADIYYIQYEGKSKNLLTKDGQKYETSARVSPDGNNIAFISMKDGEIYQANLIKNKEIRDKRTDTWEQFFMGTSVKISSDSEQIQTWNGNLPYNQKRPRSRQTRSSEISISCVPYIHQIYDTPDTFNGYWACNASSALMAICYYGKLPYWNVTVSSPFSHTSHYGRYVSESYTYNGYTYNIGSPDKSGKTAYGGYGYIVRDNWKDTKGYMRDYIKNHGLTSSVDCSPTWDELKSNVNSKKPLVVLTDLTAAAGHYIVAIGYYDS